jgi:hypothetical protein
MFEQILDALSPHLGFYISGDKRKPAIVRSYAIEQDVFGLEVVIGDSSFESNNYGRGCKAEIFQTKVYLTQHEGGSYSIYEAIDQLKEIGWKMEAYWVNVSKQANVKRAVVTIWSNCIC